VVRFLSPEWVAALDRAASTHPDLAGATAEVDLVVEHHVAGIWYHVSLDHGRVRFTSGPATAPTVTFSTDRRTAAAIARGELSAQRAFMAGRLRVAGDVIALTRAQAVFARLPDIFAQVRADTEY
jgi:putative sterol carrier protein